GTAAPGFRSAQSGVSGLIPPFSGPTPPSGDARRNHASAAFPNVISWPEECGLELGLGGGTGPAGMRLLCATVLSALALSRAVASEPTIVVEGNRRIDAQAIREHFHVSSEGLTPAAIDAALKELFGTGLFEEVHIVRSGTRLVVAVVEAPQIEDVRFEGNKQVKDKDLANEISLKPRSAMTKAAVREDVARIVETYHRNGRYQVEVKPTTTVRGDGRVDLIFEIR